MIRKIITIDESRCDGCGLCAKACHEGAIAIVDGKAKLLREDYCDGLGDCLPACPTGAISFEEREAPPYDEAAVFRARKKRETAEREENLPLRNFPIQIKLVPENAPYFENADLLIAADCTAYAYCNFHRDFMKNKITLIGCPKLDGVNYSEKLTRIFRDHKLRSVTVVRMTVPCCGGLTYAVETALKNSGAQCDFSVINITPNGTVFG